MQKPPSPREPRHIAPPHFSAPSVTDNCWDQSFPSQAEPFVRMFFFMLHGKLQVEKHLTQWLAHRRHSVSISVADSKLEVRQHLFLCSLSMSFILKLHGIMRKVDHEDLEDTTH